MLQMPKDIDMHVPMSMSPGMAALMQAAALQLPDEAAPERRRPPGPPGTSAPGAAVTAAGVPETPHSLLDPLNCLTTPRHPPPTIPAPVLGRATTPAAAAAAAGTK